MKKAPPSMRGAFDFRSKPMGAVRAPDGGALAGHAYGHAQSWRWPLRPEAGGHRASPRALA